MRRYLKATGRRRGCKLADQVAGHLTADPEVYANPEKYFDQVIEINLSELEPHINGPFHARSGNAHQQVERRSHQKRLAN
jgi:aconitate hydratase